MVRLGRFAAALSVAAGLALATGAPAAHAQSLQRLTVLSFALASDTGAPSAGVPFHLVVTLRVRERVGRIDNLELPILAELELLGDERRLDAASDGTSYRETIAVVARNAGKLAIGPALLQAIDPRDRRAKQYSTNGLTLNVTGSAPSLESPASAALAVLRIALWLAGAACAIAVVVLTLRRRRVSTPAPAPPPPAPPPPLPARVRSTTDELADALSVLRTERTRATAVRVRALVWHVLGATEGETLTDVLRRPQAALPRTRELLRSLERASFTYDADVPAAIDAAVHALQRYIEELG